MFYNKNFNYNYSTYTHFALLIAIDKLNIVSEIDLHTLCLAGMSSITL